MKKNLLNIALGLVIGAVFLWLSLRNIELSELRDYVSLMSYQWIAPFIFFCFLSFIIRSERWFLLLKSEHPNVKRSTLLSGILTGYLVNYAIPRLGELTRSVYVAKKENISSSNILGTVVLERIIDVICIGVMVLFVLIFVVSDRQTFYALFGPEAIVFVDGLMSPWAVVGLMTATIISLFLGWKAIQYLYRKRAKDLNEGTESQGLFRILFMFTDGLISIRKLKKWPLFVVYTILMWFVYAMLTYIPLYAFNLVELHNIDLLSAFSVMVIATIGVMLPSPGAVGTYHWFVKQSLLVLFSVPAVTGLAYAFVAHAAMLFSVLLFTPLTWLYIFLKGR